MTANLQVEEYASSWVYPYLQTLYPGYRVMPVPGNIPTQHRFGDIWLSDSTGKKAISVDLKAEERHTGNLFIEMWSNEAMGVQGWLFHYSDDTRLAYAFNDCHKLYSCKFGELRKFCFSHGQDNRTRIHDFKEVIQKKYDQSNRTIGRLLPVEVFMKEVIGAKAHQVDLKAIQKSYQNGLLFDISPDAARN